ncbi:MAG: type II secretion system protein N [Casimicrobiaceae bacterium]
MMMRGLLRALLALLVAAATAFAVVSIAPASVAGWAVSRASPATLRLTDTDGTLRNGRGRLSDAAGRWSLPLAWTLDGSELWRGALIVHVGGSAADLVHGTLRATPSTLRATGFEARLPASMATNFLPPGIALAFGGNVVVSAPDFAIDSHADGFASAGHASASWSPARMADAAGNAIDLGTLTADANAAGGRVDVELANAGGDTAIAGGVHVAGERVDADVTLTPRGAPPPLLHSLASFGTATASGGTRFSYHGTH